MSVGAQVGNLSWKMCSHCWGHEKSTMLNQALGPAPIFSKIAFYTPIRVQVGSLSEKCVLLAMTIQNRQCSFRPLSLPQLFQNGPWHVCWGSSSEPELENVLPLLGPRKIINVESGPWPCPKLFQNCILQNCQGSGWEPE